MKHTIDAQGKKIGRIASEAAAHLIGKSTPAFARNEVGDESVEITNAAKADVTVHKKTSDVYVTFTGYRGGLKEESLGELITRRGMTEVLTRAVYGMLPNNKLRSIRMKKLTIKE